jgi:hypothetical protein
LIPGSELSTCRGRQAFTCFCSVSTETIHMTS